MLLLSSRWQTLMGGSRRWAKLAFVTLVEAVILLTAGCGPIWAHLWVSDRF